MLATQIRPTEGKTPTLHAPSSRIPVYHRKHLSITRPVAPDGQSGKRTRGQEEAEEPKPSLRENLIEEQESWLNNRSRS